MNLKSEQIKPDLNLEINYDQPLTKKQIYNKLIELLGKDNCDIEKVNNHSVFVYKNINNKKTILLCAACTYLGGNGQHPIFKKRIQLSLTFKDICLNCNPNYDVRLIGVYHYEGLIIFIDFEKETYLRKKMHNSAAHVYINDLYQAIRNDVFDKTDYFGNKIHTIKATYFKNYLDGISAISPTIQILNLFKKFNYGFPFGEWLTAISCIQEMKDKNWKQWRQTEWAGWFLEYKYNYYVESNNLSSKMKYMGLISKANKEYDFDIWFEEANFYGDLKASDISKKVAPGNDQKSFIDCINKYGHFWYVIYEHKSISDKDCNSEAESFRKQLLIEDDPKYFEKHANKSNSTNHRFINNRVFFEHMMIIELNRINYHDVLSDFNQGRLPGGGERAKKFNINKRNIDNFIMLNYSYGE